MGSRKYPMRKMRILASDASSSCWFTTPHGHSSSFARSSCTRSNTTARSKTTRRCCCSVSFCNESHSGSRPLRSSPLDHHEPPDDGADAVREGAETVSAYDGIDVARILVVREVEELNADVRRAVAIGDGLVRDRVE